MADQFDQAAKLEQQALDIALSSHKPVKEQSLIIDGIRICLDCAIPVPQVRIEAVDAVRCVDCQTLNEFSNNRRK
ncbi:TraR/DksA C4-type zinc finger protein [Cognaticolwellia mytili]|uniref:hypothetical protein n=1 Tax=Cognaticolwellia mytili TaxID=1888913 RepID=UPI000A175983|nr:hypothetical protein [Cognaticolwellia mytili]